MAEAEGRALVGLLRACKPAFREGRKADRLAFALNAYFLCKGYKLIAVGQDADGLDKVVNKTEEVDVDGWNKEETDYCFAYIPEGEDQVRVLVLCVYLGSKLCIQALAKKIGEGQKAEREPVSLEMGVDVFIQEPSGGDVKSAFKDLTGMVEQFSKFESAVKRLQLSDEGEEEEEASKNKTKAARGEGEHVVIPSRSTGDDSSSSPVPDPLRIHRPTPLGVYRPAVPLIGADDLVPPGVRPPGMPFEPPMPSFGGPLRGSHVGPRDPIFSGQRGGVGGVSGLRPSHLPPGARFDPINPPGMRGFHPDDFIQGERPLPDGRGFGEGGRVHPDIGGPPEGGGNGMDYMFG